MAGILSTYVTHAVIAHNEVVRPGLRRHRRRLGLGRQRPRTAARTTRNRGLYDYQPVYTTPTTLRDTVVSHNLVHGTKKVFHDGGSIYNLSANPGSVIDHNYIYDNRTRSACTWTRAPAT